ncbi:MAG: FAD-dependent oxidoreductase [Oscillospiraceae bacterium]|nr:FAD-dependent oxidoreductase [Oscillospiraceae bacterium]
MDKTAAIFRPLKLGNLELKNRIEVAPAAPFLTGHDGSVTPEFYQYTVNLAKSGAAVVTIGVTNVDQSAPGGGRILSATRGFLSDLNDIAEGIQRYGAKASIELVYSKYMLTPAEIVVNKTTTEEVEDIIRNFAAAAGVVKAAGFDMLMIHGGHGNVPSMFYNKKYNRRTDRFGERTRFGVELLEAVRAAVGPGFPIEYRISAEEILPGMTTLEETLEYAKVIQPYIDMLHVSRGLLEVDDLLPQINAPVYLPRAMNLPFAKKFKEALDIPVSVIGSFDLETAERVVAAGEVDVVAMIRNVLADTECVNKARKGQDDQIRPCVRCNTCIGRTHSQFKSVRCAVNPLIGRETRFDLRKAEKSKKVLVVGGGPAGLEAARTAANRGHSVVLCEKTGELGGNFRMACAADFKAEMKKYLQWSIRTVEEHPNIEVRMNTAADEALVKSVAPDAIIVAAGAVPILPTFTASGTDKVAWSGDVELGKAKVGDKVVIAGAGLTGMELAVALSRHGKQVTIIDMVPEDKVGAGANAINLICIKQLLKEAGVTFHCEVRLEDVTDEGATVAEKDGSKTVLPCDTLVLSLGFRPNAAAMETFRDLAEDVYFVGDCNRRGGTLAIATQTGFDAAMQI